MIAETFVYRGWEWPIPALRELVADRAPVDIAVAEFAPMLLNEIHVDTSYTGQDLTAPVLVCDLTTPVDGHARLIIDGWHRLHAAVRQGVETLPARILTVAEGLSRGGPLECVGCEHCVHVQFDAVDAAKCYYPCCDLCGAKWAAWSAADKRAWEEWRQHSTDQEVAR